MFELLSENKVLYKISAGQACGESELNAFDRALLNAGCGNYNLLRVSSILPAGAAETDSISLKEGSLLATAFARFTAAPGENTGEDISAAVGIGIPADKTKVGVIMECAGVCSEEHIRDEIAMMVKTAMEDRGISDYSFKCAATSRVSSQDHYDCVFAYVAIFN